MKWFSVLGTVMVLAICSAFTASASASASAVFCDTAASPCPSGHAYAPGTPLTSKVSLVYGMKITSPLLPLMTCGNGKADGTITSSGVQFTAFSLSCSSSFDICNVEGRNLPWTSVLSAGTAGNGTLTISSARLNFACSQSPPCEVEATGIPLGVTGTSTRVALLKIAATFAPVPNKCSASDSKKLEGAFEITAPKPLYVETQ